MHAANDLIEVADHHALGQFELQAGRVEQPCLHQAAQVLDEVGLHELQGADVHRQRQVPGAGVLAPKRQLRAGTLDHPSPQRLYQSGLLGQRNELHGRDPPALRVAPPQKHLGTRNAAPHIDLGLEEGLDLTQRQGLAKVGLEPRAARQAFEHRRLEEDDAVAPRQLGLVHRGVSTLLEFTRGHIPALEHRHPEAARHMELPTGQGKGRLQRQPALLGHASGFDGGQSRILVQTLEHDDEFIAALARHGVG